MTGGKVSRRRKNIKCCRSRLASYRVTMHLTQLAVFYISVVLIGLRLMSVQEKKKKSVQMST